MPNQLPSGMFPHGSPLVTAARSPGRGRVWYVSSTAALTADDVGGNGGSPLRPFATLDYAIGQCVANQGDVIVVLENHAETLTAASAVNFDIAGITVVGLGLGDDRPTFNFTTAAAANILIGAANIEISNFVLTCGFASHTTMMTINASGDGAYIHHNEFREGTQTGQTFITMTGAADDVRIEDNYFYNPTAGNMTRGIYGNAGGAFTRAKIKRNFVYGDFDVGCIASTNAFTLADIRDNVLINTQLGISPIALTGSPTGVFGPNIMNQRAMDGNTKQIVRHVKSNAGSGTTVWNTNNSPITVFNVTGDVLARCWGVVGATALTSTGATGTLALGVTGNTGGFIAATTVDGTNFSINSVWTDTSPVASGEVLSNTSGWMAIGGGGDILITVATNPMTAGVITLYCEYIPLTPNSAVFSATSE